MLRCDAIAAIRNREHRVFSPTSCQVRRMLPPAGVAHGIVDEVGEGAAQFFLVAGEPEVGVRNQADVVVACAAHQFAHLLQRGEHGRYIHRALVARGRGGFEFREGEQVFDQARHAPRLVVHGLEMLLQVGAGRFVHVLEGFEEAGEHGERRAQFVRDVGHEVAAHGFKVREVRGVVRDHQFLETAKRNNAYRERPLRLRGRGHLQRLAVLAAFQIGVERRIAHQVDEALAGVARRGNTEQALARDVRPLDLVVRGDDQHRVRRGGGCALEARQHFGEPVFAPLGVFHQRADAVEHLAPQAAGVRTSSRLLTSQRLSCTRLRRLEAMYRPKPSAAIRERVAGDLGQHQARERDAEEDPDLAPEIPGHASVLGREPVAGAAYRLDEAIVAARG